jgi:hypothetical protein
MKWIVIPTIIKEEEINQYLLKVMGAGFKRKKSEKVRSLIQLTD